MLRVTSFASGSSGNAFLVETERRPVLVEAGLAARTLERLLRQRDIDPASLAAIVVSHEHHDHAQGAGTLARRWEVPVVCSAGTQRMLGAELNGVDWLPLDDAGVTVDGIDLWGFPLPHDAEDPQGILLRSGATTVGWALDLGHVPDHLPGALSGADLVIVEANHDRELLESSPYPRSTKQRIMSDHGHLSNLQAAQLLAAVAEAGRMRAAWLAHLSARTNDHPRQVMRKIEAFLDMAGYPTLPLSIAQRDHPSAVWQAENWLQQALL